MPKRLVYVWSDAIQRLARGTSVSATRPPSALVVKRVRVERVAHAPVVHKGEKRVQQAHGRLNLARLVEHEGVHKVLLVPAVGQFDEKRVALA